MSRIPRIDKKPKNNKSTKFRWVDSQWEKLLTKQSKLKAAILKLEMQNAEMIDRLIRTGDEAWLKSEGILTPTNFSQMEIDFEVTKNTENDDFEVKRNMIYESPDGGKTIYGRRAGDKVREQFNRECD